MEITWLGRTCFRLSGRDGVVLTDPCPPGSGYKIGKQQVSIVTFSRAFDPEYTYREVVPPDAMTFDAPGEYEHNNILVTGVARKRPDGERNVMFFFEMDGIRIGHLGLPGPSGPPRIDEIKDVDILLMPVGGGISLGAAAAADVMTTIEPKIAIPMHYRTDSETLAIDPIDAFVKETGSTAEPQPKLSVTRGTLGTDLSVVILEPRS
jgi:L-ascorbate metabolism protein UlaG (beta-lactamase superfamily)